MKYYYGSDSTSTLNAMALCQFAISVKKCTHTKFHTEFELQP